MSRAAVQSFDTVSPSRKTPSLMESYMLCSKKTLAETWNADMPNLSRILARMACLSSFVSALERSLSVRRSSPKTLPHSAMQLPIS